MVWVAGRGALAAIALVAAAGCVESDATNTPMTAPESAPPSGAPKGDATLIRGSVVDVELVPIAGVTVTATPGNQSATTDSAGAYSIGPVEPGPYALKAEKAGYAGKEVRVEVASGEPAHVVLTLERLPSAEGYYETQTFAGYIQCQFHLSSPLFLNVPCSTFGVEYVGGPKTIDSYQFLFEISPPGFQELVFEATWQPSATVVGGAQFWIENPETAVNYINGAGSTPIWHKATAGIANDGNDEVFYPTPNAAETFRMAMIGLGGGASPVPNFYHWIEWRFTIYLSLFYNGLVPDGFTVLTE